jgi:hypothetical protein
LGLHENAARMRVERALERLRNCLTRRGITSSAAGLALLLAKQVVGAAPLGLAASVHPGAQLEQSRRQLAGSRSRKENFVYLNHWMDVGVIRF